MLWAAKARAMSCSDGSVGWRVVSRMKFLESAPGRDGGDERAGRVADMGPDMGDLSWGEVRVAGAHDEALAADLGNELAGDHIEPFVLPVVNMARRAALAHVGVLKDEELAAGVLGGELGGEGELSSDAGAVLGAAVPLRHQSPMPIKVSAQFSENCLQSAAVRACCD